MINISIIGANGKSYSVKYDVEVNHNNDNSTKVKIIGVDLVEPITAASYKKIKTIFERENILDILNRDRYGLIYDNLIKLIMNRYKPSSITFI